MFLIKESDGFFLKDVGFYIPKFFLFWLLRLEVGCVYTHFMTSYKSTFCEMKFYPTLIHALFG